MKGLLLARTASVVLTSGELRAIKEGCLRILYRPITLHWDGQFGKFLEPRATLLDGTPAPDLIHLMEEGDKVIVDKHGRERKVISRRETRVLREITDQGVFPEDYYITYENLEVLDRCWVLILGSRVRE